MEAEVLYSFSSNEDDELNVIQGIHVRIIDQSDSDWWICQKDTGERGLLPSNYLHILNDNERIIIDSSSPKKQQNEEEEETRPSPLRNMIQSPVISSDDLPEGWKMFVEKDSGDIYYFNEQTGETTWDPPPVDDQPQNLSPSSSYLKKNSSVKSISQYEEDHPLISSATEDLEDLKLMRLQADSKMNALKHAIEIQSSPKPSPIQIKQPTNNYLVNSEKNINTPKRPDKKPLTELSIDEINKIIDERILREVKKREEEILQKVQNMISASSPTKQKKREQAAQSTKKLPTITRSADSKYKTNSSRNESQNNDPGILAAVDDRPKTVDEREPSTQFTPIKPLDLKSIAGKKERPTGGVQTTQPKRVKALQSPHSNPSNTESNPIFPPVAKHHQKKNPQDDDGDGPEHFSSPFARVASNDNGLNEDDSSIGKNSVIDNDTAVSSLDLTFVHGYDGDCAKNSGAKVCGKNILWLNETTIIYPAAILVIIMNITTQQQTFYRGHTEEVSALTLHPNRRLIASGQMGKDSRILVWDSSALISEGQKNQSNSPSRAVHRLSPRYEPPVNPTTSFHREILIGNKTRGILALNFSSDGALLLALALDESQPLFVYDWAKNELLASCKLGHVDVFQVGFNPFLYIPLDKSSFSDDQSSKSSFPDDNICCYTIVTCLTRGVKFWALHRVKERNDVVAIAGNGSQFKGRKIAVPKSKQSWVWKYVLEGNVGLFPKKNTNTPPDMTCFSIISELNEPGTLPRSKILTGGSNGSIYIWQQMEAVPSTMDTSREDYIPQYWLPRGRLICVVTDVHEGPLVDLDTFFHSSNPQNKHRIGTCGKDGILNLWNLDGNNVSSDVSPMEHVTAVNISAHSPTMGFPRSCHWCQDGNHLILGTTGNTICLIKGQGLGTTSISPATRNETNDHSASHGDIRLDIVIHGHVGKINRIVSHPFKDIFATIGADKSVRLWSQQWLHQVALTRVASTPTSIVYLPDGSAVAIGTEIGEILILTCTFLQKILETGDEPRPTRKRVKWELIGRKFIGTTRGAPKGGPKEGKKNLLPCEITEMKFSPDGEYLAVAGRDKTIHLLSAKNGYKKVGMCKGHSGVIIRMDFTTDSAYLQSSDGSRETLLWEVPSGKQCNGANSKDFIWATWSNPLGSCVKGILNGPSGVIEHSAGAVVSTAPNGNNSNGAPSAAEIGMINGIHRSNDQKSLVVAGGGNGFLPTKLKLFRFPCHKQAKSKEYSGHASAIEDACFLISDNSVVSVGTSDSCVMCWTVK